MQISGFAKTLGSEKLQNDAQTAKMQKKSQKRGLAGI